MIFDVMIREGYTDEDKQIVNTYRVHDMVLNHFLRTAQDEGRYVHSVIALFKKRLEQPRVEQENRQREEETIG